MARKPIQFEDFPESLDVQFGPFRAVVEHITDADTCYLPRPLRAFDGVAYCRAGNAVNCPEFPLGNASGTVRVHQVLAVLQAQKVLSSMAGPAKSYAVV